MMNMFPGHGASGTHLRLASLNSALCTASSASIHSVVLTTQWLQHTKRELVVVVMFFLFSKKLRDVVACFYVFAPACVMVAHSLSPYHKEMEGIA